MLRAGSVTHQIERGASHRSEPPCLIFAFRAMPAGKYGKAALTYLGVWDAVAPRVAQAENARAALTFVARGEAPLGIVYGTDAKSEPAVKVVGTFPENSHPRILYPVTLTASAKPEARKFRRKDSRSREKSARRRAECDAGMRGAPSTSLDIIWPLSLGYLPPGCRHFIHRRRQFLPSNRTGSVT